MTRCIFVTLCIIPASVFAATPAENLVDKPDTWYRSDEGRQAVACILSWQTAHGGWPKNKDTTREPFSGSKRPSGTFDNGATTGELRVLARAVRVTGNEQCRAAFLKGFDHILAAQYPNSGFRQNKSQSTSLPPLGGTGLAVGLR